MKVTATKHGAAVLTTTKFAQGNWYVLYGDKGKLLDFFIDHNGWRTEDIDPLSMEILDIELESFQSQLPDLLMKGQQLYDRFKGGGSL